MPQPVQVMPQPAPQAYPSPVDPAMPQPQYPPQQVVYPQNGSQYYQGATQQAVFQAPPPEMNRGVPMSCVPFSLPECVAALEFPIWALVRLL